MMCLDSTSFKVYWHMLRQFPTNRWTDAGRRTLMGLHHVIGKCTEWPIERMPSLLKPRFQKNLDWGEARSGHPEGTGRAHIAEIEPNLETLHKTARSNLAKQWLSTFVDEPTTLRDFKLIAV
jgi:hypothetical protein